MHDSIFANAFRWLWGHKPDLMILIVMVTSAIWFTDKTNKFSNRIDHVDTRLDHVETRLDRVGTRLDHVETRLDRVETRLDHVETRLDRVETKLDHVQAEMRDNQKRNDEQFLEIKLILTRMETFLATKEKDYPKK